MPTGAGAGRDEPGQNKNELDNALISEDAKEISQRAVVGCSQRTGADGVWLLPIRISMHHSGELY